MPTCSELMGVVKDLRSILNEVFGLTDAEIDRMLELRRRINNAKAEMRDMGA